MSGCLQEVLVTEDTFHNLFYISSSGGYGLSTLRSALQENLVIFNVTEDGRVGKFDFGLTRYVNILMVDNTRVGFSHTQDPNYIVTSYDDIAGN